MRLKVLIFILGQSIIISSEKVNLECSSTRSKNSCQCEVKIDSVTNLPISETKCEYLELQEFPTTNALDLTNSLDLSHNKFKGLLEGDVTSEFGETIFILKLCHNTISHIDNLFFKPLPNLKSLDLSHNNLTTLSWDTSSENLVNLEVLDLSHNQIGSVSDGVFKSLKNLKNLNLSYNPLYNILQDPTALMNKLGVNQDILSLRLDHVGVTRIHGKCWNNFKKIEYLSVADNPITEIPQTPSTLKYLDISGTNITNLHENYLKYTNLKVLKMSRMKNLISIPHYAFYNLGNLEELFLAGSPKFQDFSEYSFGLLDGNMFPRKLRKFDLSRNRLSTLNETYKFIFHEMEQVDVSFNPWHCDCDLLWMKKADDPMIRKNYMRCASPIGNVNKLILKLKPKDTPVCYPEIYGKRVHQTALLFLTIVVFALIVIVIYLCLYSPSWSIKIGRTKVAPDSPYSINNEQI